LKANGNIAVDTNAVIAYRSGNAEVCRLINEADIIFIPATVSGELLYGAVNSGRVTENRQAVYDFLSCSVFIPIDEKITARYAEVRYGLKKIGRPMPENDIWIAAVCLDTDIPLLTQDGHFENVRGLNVIKFS